MSRLVTTGSCYYPYDLRDKERELLAEWRDKAIIRRGPLGRHFGPRKRAIAEAAKQGGRGDSTGTSLSLALPSHASASH